MISFCAQMLLLMEGTFVLFSKTSSMGLVVNSMVMIVPSPIAIAALFGFW
jgi:hypothetical protein